ncbi:ABC-type transport system involved in cytochrome bd biosynthesis, fused ATPase and permease components [Lysinibacillus capsici]|uniref:ABC-type transport system involved in cytochrome bd biosynthesis, fused ATPase and permease components n=1 Tax=Lysinibacillus capsici TaxID=2115968 RepID=A0A2X1B751_9BACI|nr:ATP-binding protein [Lysinibacillus capsici]SPU37362.1 ABC-type transport system involved in cytochrome bd biosynthesis, fused ATPase and permease components [Lysinibacillus capsici]
MSIEQYLEVIKLALNNGENVIITGDAGVGKTTLLRALEKDLDAEGDMKVVYISGGENPNSYYELALSEVEIGEILNNKQGKKVILIDELTSFQNTLSYVRTSTRIVAVAQGINEDQILEQMKSFDIADVNFTKIVKLEKWC